LTNLIETLLARETTRDRLVIERIHEGYLIASNKLRQGQLK